VALTHVASTVTLARVGRSRLDEPAQRVVPRDVVLREAQEFSARWDASDREARCERARRSFLERFPRTRLPQLRIEQYAGGLPGTFCDVLTCNHKRTECEHKDTGQFYDLGNPISIAGVYRGLTTGTFRTMRKKERPERVFELIRGELVRMLEHIERGEWQQADALPNVFSLCQLRVRAASMYFPALVAPTDRVQAIVTFLALTGLGDGRRDGDLDPSWKKRSSTVLRWGRELLARVRDVPLLSSWSPLKVCDFVVEFQERHEVVSWAIWVNPDAWSSWQTGGYASLPWSEVGSLANERDYETFHDRFVRQYREAAFDGKWWEAKKGAAALWAFRGCPIGDPLVAFVRRGGRSQVVGVGVVEGDYHFASDSAAGHRLQVRWQALPAWSPKYHSWFRGGFFLTVPPAYLAGGLGIPLPGHATETACAEGPEERAEAGPEAELEDAEIEEPDNAADLRDVAEGPATTTFSDAEPEAAALRAALDGQILELIRRHLQERAAVDRPIDAELLADLGRLRNRLEPKLRRFVRLQLKAHRGAQWIQPILEALPRERRAQCEGIAADEILRTRLFLLDLITVVHIHWGKYFAAFEAGPPRDRLTREQVKVLLDYVNTHRPDAHAGEISAGQVASLRIAIEALEKAVDRHLDDPAG
jgi:hypothetical protein